MSLNQVFFVIFTFPPFLRLIFLNLFVKRIAKEKEIPLIIREFIMKQNRAQLEYFFFSCFRENRGFFSDNLEHNSSSFTIFAGILPHAVSLFLACQVLPALSTLIPFLAFYFFHLFFFSLFFSSLNPLFP